MVMVIPLFLAPGQELLGGRQVFLGFGAFRWASWKFLRWVIRP
jgi:hypothetical protein